MKFNRTSIRVSCGYREVKLIDNQLVCSNHTRENGFLILRDLSVIRIEIRGVPRDGIELPTRGFSVLR